MNTIKSLLGTTRVPFLILTPACVAIGVGTAYWQLHEINWSHALLICFGAISAHISVNVFNEYFDFKSGLDLKTFRTPFSGGSGSLPSNPQVQKASLIFAWVTFIITTSIGVYFIHLRGWELLPIGIIGLLLLVTYTIWWVYHPVLCLFAPGLGFGILMVLGTHFSLTGTLTITSFIAALVPTFLVSDLLLLNQFPDVEADKSIGRKHFPITIGLKASSILFGIFLVLAYLSIILGVLFSFLPIFSLIALLPTILAWRAYKGVRKNAENPSALIPSMGVNVIINLSTPILLAIGLFIGTITR